MEAENKRRLPRVATRKEYMDTLASMNRPPKAPRTGEGPQGRVTQLKAYLVEANQVFRDGTGDKVSWEVQDTGVDAIKILNVRDTDGRGEIRQFYLDMADERFLLLHTDELADRASEAVAGLVNSYDHTFDHTWFYSRLMERWARELNGEFGGFVLNYAGTLYDRNNTLKVDASGTNAKMLYDHIPSLRDAGRLMSHEAIEMSRGSRKSLGEHVEERVVNNGYFSIKRGNSIQDHLHIVEECKDDYKSKVTQVEGLRMGATSSNGSRSYSGRPITITFPRVERLERFIDTLFSTRDPFRLWGTKIKRKDGQYSVPAVDLHEGSAINFEITPEMMRIYLDKGSCGNTVMRLLMHLQSEYSAETECEDLE